MPWLEDKEEENLEFAINLHLQSGARFHRNLIRVASFLRMIFFLNTSLQMMFSNNPQLFKILCLISQLSTVLMLIFLKQYKSAN